MRISNSFIHKFIFYGILCESKEKSIYCFIPLLSQSNFHFSWKVNGASLDECAYLVFGETWKLDWYLLIELRWMSNPTGAWCSLHAMNFLLLQRHFGTFASFIFFCHWDNLPVLRRLSAPFVFRTLLRILTVKLARQPVPLRLPQL